jgi:phosphopantothenoylcysteine decarboxylase / phosphopantothenate---cysteine ligase
MITPSSNPSVLLVVGGGIAAYKSLELIRLLRGADIGVRTVLTEAGAEFVTPLSLAALSGEKVFQDLFSLTDETEMGHIELSRSADLVVVAPATADLLAKAANGLANDLASTLLLASDKPILAAPAMNWRMWEHAATRRNRAQLAADGVKFIGPNEGEMACGEFGFGRMAEPAEIFHAVHEFFTREKRRNGVLAGKRVVITAGPTHEPIDPVRFIANRSSGKQGYAIARAAHAAGAQVVLVSGPVSLPSPEGVHVLRVESARDMAAAVEDSLPCDIFIAAAAVADWRVAQHYTDKIKKAAKGPPELKLIENPDILATISRRDRNRPALVVGFAAETEKLVEHARQKLARKGCDLIVANDVSASAGVMGGDENTMVIVTPEGETEWPKLGKDAAAAQLVELAASLLRREGR